MSLGELDLPLALPQHVFYGPGHCKDTGQRDTKVMAHFWKYQV